MDYAGSRESQSASLGHALSHNRHLALFAILLYAAFSHWYVWSRNVPRNAAGDREYATIRFSDEQHYYQHAADRFVDDGFAYLATEDSLRSPPMPWVWYLLWGRNIVLTRIANIGCILLGAFLIGRIARRFNAQLLATFVTAVSYQAAYYSGSILTEPLAFFFVCLSLYSLHRACAGDAKNRWILSAGLFAAFAIYSRPSLQPWPVVFLILVLLSRWIPLRRRSSSRNAKNGRDMPLGYSINARHALLLLFACLSIQAPWIIKNAYYFDAPRIANGLGAVLYLGAETKTNADEPGFSGMQWPNVAIQGPHGHMSLDGENRLKKAAWEKIGDNVGPWLKLMPVKAMRVLCGGPRWHFQPGRTLHESKLWLGRTRGWVRYIWWTCFGTLVCVYGLVGLMLLATKKDAVGLAGAALVITLLVVHVVTYAMPRFLVPAWPAIALGAAYAAVRLRWYSHLSVGGVAAIIIVAITVWHVGDARREVSTSRRNAFTIACEARFDEASANVIELPCNGFTPRFNTCIFVSANLQSSDRSGGELTAKLLLEPVSAQKNKELNPIELEMRVDGETHHYMQCIEFEPDWRNAKWRAVKLIFPDEPEIAVVDLTVAVGF